VLQAKNPDYFTSLSKSGRKKPVKTSAMKIAEEPDRREKGERDVRTQKRGGGQRLKKVSHAFGKVS